MSIFYAFYACVLELVEATKRVAKTSEEQMVEVRNLVAVGDKNAIGTRRVSWRVLPLALIDV